MKAQGRTWLQVKRFAFLFKKSNAQGKQHVRMIKPAFASREWPQNFAAISQARPGELVPEVASEAASLQESVQNLVCLTSRPDVHGVSDRDALMAVRQFLLASQALWPYTEHLWMWYDSAHLSRVLRTCLSLFDADTAKLLFDKLRPLGVSHKEDEHMQLLGALVVKVEQWSLWIGMPVQCSFMDTLVELLNPDDQESPCTDRDAWSCCPLGWNRHWTLLRLLRLNVGSHCELQTRRELIRACAEVATDASLWGSSLGSDEDYCVLWFDPSQGWSSLRMSSKSEAVQTYSRSIPWRAVFELFERARALGRLRFVLKHPRVSTGQASRGETQ